MLEIILCSLVTILPDYLYRRYRQGKRFGHEITLFSVWFELRFGIISLPDAHGRADHDDLLFSSVDQFGDVVLSHRPDHARSRPAGLPRSTSTSARPSSKAT